MGSRALNDFYNYLRHILQAYHRQKPVLTGHECYNLCSSLEYDIQYSRFFENSSQAAAHQQEKLLGEEDPGDLL